MAAEDGQAELNEDQALALFKAHTDPSGATEQPEEQTADATPDAAIEADKEAEPETRTESEGESDEQKPDASPELPETAEQLAEAYGVPVEKLAETLKVKVKVDGQEQVVTLGEAVKGYQLESDYRKKTGKLGDERRQFDELAQQAARSWDAKFQALDTLDNFLRQEIGILSDPNELDRLFENDRDAYDRRKRDVERKVERFNAAQAERQRLTAQQTQEVQMRMAQRRNEEIERFIGVAPEMNDASKQAAFEKDAVKLLESVGFNKQEIAAHLSGVWDHREMMILRKAMKADQIEQVQKKVAPIVKNVPKMLKPGSTRGPGERPDPANEVRARLRKNPSNESALEYFSKVVHRT